MKKVILAIALLASGAIFTACSDDSEDIKPRQSSPDVQLTEGTNSDGDPPSRD